jgi:PAS domain S-box-containing protein
MPGEAAAAALEEQTRLNEQRYRALVQAVSTFVWVADASGNFTTPQSGWEEYTGHGFDRHRGAGWIEDVHPDDRAGISEKWTNAVRTNSWYEVEWRCWHGRTQRWRRCLTRGVPILSADGSVREWVGAVTDIEHRLETEQILEQEWLRMAQSAGGLALWERTPGTANERWMLELYQIYGVRPGSTVGDLEERIHPEDRGKASAARARAAISGHLDVTYRIVFAGGQIRWLREKGSAVPHDPSGKMVGVLVDVTDLMELQENHRVQADELETLIDAIPAYVWISRDPECRFIVGNRAANEFLAAPPGSNQSQTPGPGQTPPRIDQFGPDGAPMAPEDLPMQRACRTRTILRGEEIEFRFPDRGNRNLLGNVVPLFDSGGRVRGCVAVFIDITDMMRTQRELARSNRELAMANDQLSHFNFAASHDLREPLRQVAIFSELLERRLEGTLDAESISYLQFCRKGALQMEHLLKALLIYAQIAGSGEPVMHATGCREALDKAVQNLSNSIIGAQANVEADDLPQVVIESSSLVHLFQNLLSNAIKYRGLDDPVIRVSAVRDGEFWRMAVADNGIGIAPQFHQQVFGMFKRLHTRSEYEGTGIGLAICQRIIERHGGRIWVESEPGKGSTFYFTLRAA